MNKYSKTLGIALLMTPTWLLAEPASQRSISVAAELDNPEVVARYEKAALPKLVCAQVESPEALLNAFRTLATHKWSRSDLGCAAGYGFRLAHTRTKDLELSMSALITQIDYLDLLASEYEGLYSGPETGAELRLRWNRARDQGNALIDQMEPFIGKTPEFRLLRATFWVASTVKESTAQQSAEAAAKAMPELEAVIAEKPDALGGLALMLLGRMTFILPEFAGGDPLRAIELLNKGVAINPQDMVMRRWLAEVLISERDYQAAKEVIKAAMANAVNENEPQAHADELRAMSGLALRAGDEALSKQIAEQRKIFLAKNPQLLTRRSVASFGHGGADPFTGKEDE